jgi:hypothetical protein
MRRFTLLAFALLAAIAPATAFAHPEDEGPSLLPDPLHMLHVGSGTAVDLRTAANDATATSPRGRGVGDLATPDGPCTDKAKEGMPEGEAHDHQDVTQHRNLRCRIEQVAFLPLTKELEDRPDVALGEMDVKKDVAAVSVIFPEGGLLLFDVSDPAKPKFKSWYRSTQCEGVVAANNCGAFVDLSPDGKTAFIAQQSLSFVPGADPDSADQGPAPTTAPGIEVVDISDLANPRRTQILPVLSQGGVHTARSHAIPKKGTYVFGIANSQGAPGAGVDISKLDENRKVLTPTARIEIGEIHDTFIQDDPIDKKTYLYIAGGYSKGLLVYDVSDPASPKQVAAWNLTPECRRDWYSHTVDVAHRNGKRIVTMPAELFVSTTDQPAADQALGCGKVSGNGDQPGPLWIIDATDFSKLGQAGDTNEQLKAKSEQALISTWINPSRRPAGNLTFSPHNQQIVGNRIYLSHYHGGVFVLDATEAFQGKAVRPRELGYIVPSGERSNDEARPAAGPQGPAGAAPRTRGRSSIWDMVFYKGHILAADQIGGFYSLHFRDDEVPPLGGGRGDGRDDGPGAGSGPGAAPIAPAGTPQRRRQLRLVRNRLSGGRLRIELRGTRARDVRRVSFRVNGRLVSVDRRSPFRVTLRLRNARQRFRIVARVTLRFGQRATLRRTLVSRAPRSRNR